MSYARYHKRFTVDWLTWALVGLMAAFQLFAIQLSSQILAYNPQTLPEQSANLSIGVGIIVIAAVEIAGILLAFKLYKYLSETWQYRIQIAIKIVVGVSIYGLGFYLYAAADLLYVYLVGVPVLIFIGWYVDFTGFKWIVFDGIALMMGVLMATAAGFQITPAVVLVVMVAFTIYDHIAVNLSDIMSQLVELSSSANIPNYVVIPNQLRFDLDDARDVLAGDADKPDSMAMMIGVGDFVFPTVLVISALVTLETVSLPVIGAVCGTLGAMIVLRHSLDGTDGGLPALPWLNTGCVLGFGAGIAMSGIAISTALGL